MRVRRQFIDGRYGQMHVRVARPEHPTQVPLYAVHQSPSSSVIYLPLLQTLGVDRVMAAGDTPGFGESDPPDSPPEVEDYAATHGEAVDALGISGPLDVMGFYTGSKIAVELALQRPRQVRRLVLLGAVIYDDAELKDEQHLYRRDEYSWDGAHLMGWWRHLVRGAPKPYPIDLFQRHFAEILRGGPNSFWGHRAAFNYDLRDKLPDVDQPTLVIKSADPQGDKTQRALQYLKRGTLLSFPYRAQGLFDLHTGEVERELRRFLDQS